MYYLKILMTFAHFPGTPQSIKVLLGVTCDPISETLSYSKLPSPPPTFSLLDQVQCEH